MHCVLAKKWHIFAMRYLYSSLVFGVVGLILSSFVGPKAIEWYFTPPVQAYLNCGPATSWAMQKLLIVQSFAFLLFAVFGLFVGAKLSRKKSVPQNQQNN